MMKNNIKLYSAKHFSSRAVWECNDIVWRHRLKAAGKGALLREMSGAVSQ